LKKKNKAEIEKIKKKYWKNIFLPFFFGFSYSFKILNFFDAFFFRAFIVS